MQVWNIDQDRDEARKQTVDLGTNQFILQRKDPYGFIHVHYAKGETPQELRGVFTSFEDAKKAIKVYANKKNRTIKE